MPRINPAILLWARETAGLTIDEAAHKIGLSEARGASGAERLKLLEQGDGEPSRPLLLRMSQQYRRPLVAFYMTAPPRRGDRGEDFRTLPEEPPPGAEAVLDTLLRGLRARQALLRAAMEDEEEAVVRPFVASRRMDDGVPALVESIQQAIGLRVEEFRDQGSVDAAFNLLRSRTERAGVYVLLIGNLGSHHSALDVDTFRGFALADNVAPFIVVNSNDARVAWSFTLVHELTHILLGATGVSGGTLDQGIERFCNDVATAFLLPERELIVNSWPAPGNTDAMAEAIGAFAQARRISRQLVAYRLYRSGHLTQPQWIGLQQRFRDDWRAELERRAEQSAEATGGPNYYVVKRHRLGRGLLEITSRMMENGALTTTRAGRVLGVRPAQVANLLAGVGEHVRRDSQA